MSKRVKIIRFKIGDRVAEKPKDNYIPNIRPEKVNTVLLNSTQRIGVVTDVYQKQDARKHTCTYYDVAWDNGRSSTHAQFRLCHEHELAGVLQVYRNAIE
jgi:hypothetical protein